MGWVCIYSCWICRHSTCVQKGISKKIFLQSSLMADLMNETYAAHNSLDDVKALQKLLGLVSSKFPEYVFGLSVILNSANVATFKATLLPLQKGKFISQSVAAKIARGGLIYNHLKMHMREMAMMINLQFLGKRLIELFMSQNMVQLFRKSLNTSHRQKVHHIKGCRHDIWHYVLPLVYTNWFTMNNSAVSVHLVMFLSVQKAIAKKLVWWPQFFICYFFIYV